VNSDPYSEVLPLLEQLVPQHRACLLPRKTRRCGQKTLVRLTKWEWCKRVWAVATGLNYSS
jgi:hypothetical protein